MRITVTERDDWSTEDRTFHCKDWEQFKRHWPLVAAFIDHEQATRLDLALMDLPYTLKVVIE